MFLLHYCEYARESVMLNKMSTSSRYKQNACRMKDKVCIDYNTHSRLMLTMQSEC